MYSKKQRIMSFLMAFLLIFTFAFINPLTVQKSDAFAFAPVLTANMSRIITGVLVSAGYIIHEGVTSTADYDIALQNMSNVIYKTLDGAQKLLLSALSVLDNVVEVPTSLYNSIVNKAKNLFVEEPLTLSEQGFQTRFNVLKTTNTNYPTITVPVYLAHNGSNWLNLTAGTFTTMKYDLREAQPYFIYRGTDSTENAFDENGIEYFYLDIFSDELDIFTPSATTERVRTFLTPDLSPYNVTDTDSNKVSACYLMNNGTANTLTFATTNSENVMNSGRAFISLDVSKININDCLIYSYFVIGPYGVWTFTDVYNKDTGEFLLQSVINGYDNGWFKGIYRNYKTTPYDYDITLSPDTTSTIVPPVTNTAGDNVITLPSELSGIIGATSSDVNIQTGTGEGETNTETMENINTNVGELVTGGELGEQVNTNIGTVEGLHGEITEQVDFGAVFDTIAQYISALDISSVTWFPIAVASFLVPFLPVISLGIILFFIDRVLNGGA